MTSPGFTEEPGGNLSGSGLAFDPSTGFVTGTPTKPGKYKITIKASDQLDNDPNVAHPFTIHIKDFAVTTPSVERTSCIGESQNTIEICGGKNPDPDTEEPKFNWTIEADSPNSLPTGLKFLTDSTTDRSNTLATTGPLAAGTYKFKVIVTQEGKTASKNYQMEVSDELEIINNAVLPAGTVKVDYPDQKLKACGGNEPYKWEHRDEKDWGEMPANLILDDNFLKQDPTGGPFDNANRYTFKLQVTDDSGAEDSKAFLLDVRAPIEMTGTTIKTFECWDVANLSWDPCFEATGGIGDLRYHEARNAGADSKLPPGLELDEKGCLDGKPSTPGTYNFDVQIVDAVSGPESEAVKESVTVEVSPYPSDSSALEIERMRRFWYTHPDYETNVIKLPVENGKEEIEKIYVYVDFHFSGGAKKEPDWNGKDCTAFSRHAVLKIVGLCSDPGVQASRINPHDKNVHCGCDPAADPNCDADYVCQPEYLKHPPDPDSDKDHLLWFPMDGMDGFKALIKRARDEGLGADGFFEFRLEIDYTCKKDEDDEVTQEKLYDRIADIKVD
jgi:hypothetical protein